MGRSPCCDKKGLKKGPWTPEEDDLLVNYIQKNGGHGSWRSLPKMAGLLRCGKSCRLRWTNYLRPNIKRGPFTIEEEKLVIQLHGIIGNRWAAIASQLPGRTDNEVKNLWNTHLKKRLVGVGVAPKTYEPFTSDFAAAAMASTSSSTRHMAQWESARLEAEARLSRESSLFNNPTLCKSTTDVDFFLRLWNSEVGEAFRKVKFETDHSTCQSPKSQNSISTKCVSVSAITTEVVVTDTAAAPSYKASNQNEYAGKSCLEELMPVSDSSSSNELGDSSDTALQLLLDFPINNDMSFLETNLDKYATPSVSLLMDNH